MIAEENDQNAGGTYMTDGADLSQGKRIRKDKVKQVFDELGPDKIKKNLIACLHSFDFFFTSKD